MIVDAKQLKRLYALEDSDKYVDTLNKVVNLMLDTHKDEGCLKGSSLIIEYRHNRLLLKAYIDKRI